MVNMSIDIFIDDIHNIGHCSHYKYINCLRYGIWRIKKMPKSWFLCIRYQDLSSQSRISISLVKDTNMSYICLWDIERYPLTLTNAIWCEQRYTFACRFIANAMPGQVLFAWYVSVQKYTDIRNTDSYISSPSPY